MSFFTHGRFAAGASAAALVVAMAGSSYAASPPEGSGRLQSRGSDPRAVGLIAYAGYGSEGRQVQVFKIRTDGSHRRQLTTTGGYDPTWSQDGTQIAFQRNDWIWRMGASVASKEKLVQGYRPAWAPDGRRLSYSCGEGFDLCVLDLATGVETLIVADTDDWSGADSSTWSPDGTWIAFTRVSTDGDDYTRNRQLFRVRADGTELTPIPHTYPRATAPDWSPNGATILYTDVYSGRGGEDSGDLWSIRPDGSGKRRVTRSAGSQLDGTWSPDGHRIVMYSSPGFPYANMAGVWTTKPDGTNREFVVRAAGSPSWHPTKRWASKPVPKSAPASGQRIAYVAASVAGYDLFTVRPDGTAIEQLTATGKAHSPAWSPDHTQIAYGSHGDYGIWVVDVRTRSRHRVSDLGYPWGFSLAWSPDGNQLAWPEANELIVYGLRTHQRTSVPLETDGSFPLYPTWSPDGRQIAFAQQSSSGGREIAVVSARGGQVRRVVHLRGDGTHLNWSPNGRRILFSTRRGPYWAETTSLFSVRPDGSDVREEMSTPGLDTDPAWSPDGQHFTYYSDGPTPYGKAPQPGIWIAGQYGESPQLVLRDRAITDVDW